MDPQGGAEAGREPVTGVRAARLREIKIYIGGNLRQHGLSIHGVASRHGISAGYVRQLFAAEGTTFTEYRPAAAPGRRPSHAGRSRILPTAASPPSHSRPALATWPPSIAFSAAASA